MIWFKIEKLEKKITTNQFSDKEGFNYLFATTIYGFINVFYTSISGYSYFSWINLIFAILITIIGLPMTYKINCSIDSKDFIKRFIAITWIVRMRLLIYTLIFLFLFINLFDLKTHSLAKDLTLCGFSFSINIFFYVLTIKSFRRLKPIE